MTHWPHFQGFLCFLRQHPSVITNNRDDLSAHFFLEWSTKRQSNTEVLQNRQSNTSIHCSSVTHLSATIINLPWGNIDFRSPTEFVQWIRSKVWIAHNIWCLHCVLRLGLEKKNIRNLRFYFFAILNKDREPYWAVWTSDKNMKDCATMKFGLLISCVSLYI